MNSALVLTCLTGVMGLLIGSFLNVVIARVPAGQSVVRPPSRCPRCATPIAPRDNLPVLSWLVLRGRARCCGAPISARYPVIEIATGAAFALIAGWVAGRADDPGWALAGHGLPHPAAVLALLGMLYLAAVSIALAVIDVDTRRLPYWIVVPSWYVGALLLVTSALAAGRSDAAVRVLVGGLGLWALYRLLHQVRPDGMGYGDVRLAGLVGGYLGWAGYAELAVGAFAGFALGAVGGLLLGLLAGGGLKRTIPFGPYMLLGTWVGLFWGEPLAAWYLNLSR